MRKFNITVNGTAYEVEVEEVAAGESAAPKAAPVAAAPKAAPASALICVPFLSIRENGFPNEITVPRIPPSCTSTLEPFPNIVTGTENLFASAKIRTSASMEDGSTKTSALPPI